MARLGSLGLSWVELCWLGWILTVWPAYRHRLKARLASVGRMLLLLERLAVGAGRAGLPGLLGGLLRVGGARVRLRVAERVQRVAGRLVGAERQPTRARRARVDEQRGKGRGRVARVLGELEVVGRRGRVEREHGRPERARAKRRARARA